ncbi:DUF3093 domain-containing protein [Mycolicibacterium fallax]|uniref:DUF3093 domain-containing protein n=1 Tax=Mycolicibacterium fallax TaxID=1793 RepID=A0A1X1RGR6_MYCFA|nr:DUF3093 domain-containing protein [Mycolicibacterium fallax]ORV05475.1 hypothetical protein AWC04_06315 [Mycolicibacterium fallax]HOW93696.1 DUF3093 domain-containing protein [Mycolicibacterium fallax]
MPDSLITTPTVRYRERQWVPLWWWLPGMALAAAMAITVNRALHNAPDWVGFAILVPAAVVTLLWLGRHVVSVVSTDGVIELWVDDAHLPNTVIERSAVVPTSAKTAALGRQLDPAAFVHHRGWIGPMTLLVLDDPDDPTPYWLISTRHPDRMLAALRDEAPA